MAQQDEALQVAARSALFEGLGPEEIKSVLHCIRGQVRTFEKNQTIVRRGEQSSRMGLVVSGGVRLEKHDWWGNRSILASIGPGRAFGEVYACLPGQAYDVNVVASEPSAVLLLDMSRLTAPCSSACGFHVRLIRNVMQAMARRTYLLTRKIDHVSKRTTREKLLSYLSDQAAGEGAAGGRGGDCALRAAEGVGDPARRDAVEPSESRTFAIPFNRQELADYLGVDRSAMCAELSRMKKEGLIDYKRNVFTFRGDRSGLDGTAV